MRDSADLRVTLHLTVYEMDGEERYHVHASVDGQPDLIDVTDQYEVTAISEPKTGREGFAVIKKNKEL